MAETPEGGEWLKSIGLLLGGGGIGAALQEGIKWFSNRGKSRESAIERHEARLREDYTNALKRIEVLEAELEDERKSGIAQLRANVAMETENTLLRNRYHRMRGYMMYWKEEVRKRLGLTDEQMPGIPEWVDEYIPGPTASQPNIPMSPQEKPNV